MTDTKVNVRQSLKNYGLKPNDASANVLGNPFEPTTEESLDRYRTEQDYDLVSPNDIRDGRSNIEAIGDFTNTAAQGLSSTLFGIGGFLGGSSVYDAGEDVNKFINSFSSEFKKRKADILAKESSLPNDIYDARAKATSLKDVDYYTTRLKQIGNNIANLDATETGANILGSALVAGGVGKAVGVGGSAISRALGGTASLGTKVGTGVGIAATTAVEPGSQAYQQVLNTPTEVLTEHPEWSEAFNKNLSDSSTIEEAVTKTKKELAERASKSAVLNTTNLGISAVTGGLGDKFSKAISKGKLVSPALAKPSSILTEGVSEFVEEANVAAQANIATKEYDPSIDIAKGVVQAGSQGLGGKGIVSSPSLAAGIVNKGISNTAKKVKEVTASPEDKEVNSIKTSLKDIDEQIDVINEQAIIDTPTEDSTDNSEELNDKLDTYVRTRNKINAKEVFDYVKEDYSELNPANVFKSITEDKQDAYVIDAIDVLMDDLIKDKFKSNKQKTQTAKLFDDLLEVVLSSPKDENTDPVVLDLILKREAEITRFKDSPKYQNAIKSLDSLVQDDSNEIDEVIKSDGKDIVLNQRKINKIIDETRNIFKNNPLGVSKKVIDDLYNNKDNLKKISDISQDSIDFIDFAYNVKQDEIASKNINEEINSKADKGFTANAETANVDNVSYEISDKGKADGKKSLTQHIKDINTSLNNDNSFKNEDGVQVTSNQLINRLRGFATHMSGKSEAVAQSINNNDGKPVKYNVFSGIKTFDKDNDLSKGQIYINTKSKNSLYTGLAVYNDAYSTINTYNNLLKQAQSKGLQLDTKPLELPTVPEILLNNLSEGSRERFSNIAPTKPVVKDIPEQTIEPKKPVTKKTSTRKIKASLQNQNNKAKPVDDGIKWDRINKNRRVINKINNKQFAFNTSTQEYSYGGSPKTKLKDGETVQDVITRLSAKPVAKKTTTPTVVKDTKPEESEISPPLNLGEDLNQVTEVDENVSTDEVTNDNVSTESEETVFNDEDYLTNTFKDKEFKKYVQDGNNLKPLSFKSFFGSVRDNVFNKSFYTNVLQDLDKINNVFNPFSYNEEFQEQDEPRALEEINNFINRTVDKATEDLTQPAINSSKGIANKKKTSVISQHLKYLLDENDNLDEDLIYKASLAFVDWQLNLSTNKLEVSSKLDEDSGKFDTIGAEPKDVHTYGQEVNNLTNSIKRYWGVKDNNKASTTYTQGIPELLAKYFIASSDRFSTELRYLDAKQENNEDPNIIKENNKHNVIIFKPYQVQDKIINNYTDYKGLFFNQNNFIKRITDNKEEIGFSINAPVTDVDRRIANRLGNITDNTAKAVQALQNIKYKLNKPLVDMYRKIGKTNLITLMSPIDNENGVYNEQVIESASGKNLTNSENITIALNTASQLENAGEDSGVYYKYSVTSVNRMQEQSGGPATNKVIRELTIPEEYTVDLTNALEVNWFKAAIAQNLGLVKLDKIKGIDDIQEALETFYKKETTQKIFKYLDGDTELDTDFIREIKGLFDNEFEPSNLHALMELNKLIKAQGDSSLKSMLMIEIDGMANGFNNALLNYNLTPLNGFTQRLMARGGIFFNLDFKNSNEFFNSGEDVLGSYEIIGKNITDNLNNPNNIYTENEIELQDSFVNQHPEIRSQIIPLLQDVGLLKESDDISVDRSNSKTVIMTVPYGSGSVGISNKLASSFVDSLYQKLSVNKLSREDTQQILDTLVFMLSFKKLKTFSNKKYDGKNNFKEVNISSERKSKQEIQEITDNIYKRLNNNLTFKLNKRELRSLGSVFEAMFGADIHTETKSALGSSYNVLKNIQNITNLQSVVGKYIFEALLKKEMNEINGIQANGVGKKTLYPSKDQIDNIFKDLKEFYVLPNLEHEKHVFDLGTSTKELKDSIKFSEDIVSKNSKSTGSYVDGVKPLGVSFSASANIGNGDGNMQQTFYTDPKNEELIKTTTSTHDGSHTSPLNASKLSEAMNKAVWDTYQENYVLPVAKQSSNFYVGLVNYLNSSEPKEKKELLELVQKTLKLDSVDEVLSKLRKDVDNLITSAAKRQANIDVTRDHVDVTINQMAGGQTPYVHKASKKRINNKKELKRLQLELQEKYTDQYKKDIEETGFELDTKEESKEIRLDNKLRKTELKNITRINDNSENFVENYDEDLYAKLNEFTREDGSILIGDVKEVLKDLKNINKKLLEKTLEIIDPNTIIYLSDLHSKDKNTFNNLKNQVTGLTDTPIEDGLIHIDSSTGRTNIFISNVSGETIAHELSHAVHATMFHKYFNGSKDELSQRQIEHIEALTILKDEFLSIEADNTTDGNVVRAVQEIVSSDNEASNLSEFVSWSLTNKKLRNVLKKEKLSSTLLQKLSSIVKKVHDAMIKYIFGKEGTDSLFDAVLYTYTRALPNSKQDVNTSSLLDTITLNQKQINTFEDINTKVDSLVQRQMNKLSKLTEPNKTVFTKTIQKLEAYTNESLSEIDKVFDLSSIEKITFKNLSNLFTLGVKGKSFNLNKLQKVYNKFIKEISYKDFMKDGTSEETAKQQYDTLTNSDPRNETNNLGTFLALSQINKNVINVLERINFNELDSIKAQLINNIDPVKIEGNADYIMNNIVNDFINSDLDSLNELTKISQTSFDIDPKITDIVSKGITKVTGIKPTSNSVSTVFDDISTFIARNDKIPTMLKDLSKELIGKTITSESIEDLMNIVKQKVQSFKKAFREVIPMFLKDEFKTITDNETYKNLNNIVGKTDIFSLGSTRSFDDVFKLLSSDEAVSTEIKSIEKRLNKKYHKKSKQLANYLVNGKAGFNLLLNANSIGVLAGESNALTSDPDDNVITDIDDLVSLYAFQLTKDSDKKELRELIKKDTNGIKVLASYLLDVQKQENSKSTGSEVNKYARKKGYLPFDIRDGKRLIISADVNKLSLQERGFTRVGDYIDPISDTNKGYYLSSVIGSPFQQGIMQTVSSTINGMNPFTGENITGEYSGFIQDSLSIEKIYEATKANPNAVESFIPVIGKNRKIIGYQRNMRPEMLDLLKQEKDITKLIGILKSRQAEESLAQEFNKRLIDRTFDLYNKDINKDNYINVATDSDKIIKDIWSVIPNESKKYIESVFGKNTFYVRKDLVNNSLGYRLPSVTDVFTGKTRFNKDVQEVTKKSLRLLFGSNAYIYLKTAEDSLQEFVKYTKEWIYLKSIVVPASNAASNVLQLKINGVSSEHIVKNGQKVFSEIKLYHKNELRKVKIDLLMPSSSEPERRKLNKELQSIEQVTNSLSIKPLIDSGEFSAVNEGVGEIDGLLSSENLGDFIKKTVDKIVSTKKLNKNIPNSVKTLGRYAIVSKDTDLYKALVQTVLYSDYIAKAIYYNDLVDNKGMSVVDAKRLVSEEFVNYNFLPGRSRNYLESIGFLWFWNFKIRSVKIAGKMIVNNPFKALLGSLFVSEFPAFGLGTPVTDNALVNQSGIGFNNLTSGFQVNPFFGVF